MTVTTAVIGEKTGFWGSVDSLQDWCEPNYVITIYIAEFFNTISSLPMIVFGLIGIYFTIYIAGIRELRYLLSFLGLSLVGFGSAAFHCSLRWHFQLLDELPMMILNYFFLYCIIQNNKPIGSPRNKPIIALFTVICSVCIINYVLLQNYWFFVIPYGGGVLGQWIPLWPYIKNGKIVNNVFIACVLCYYGGLVLWIIDLKQCAIVQPFQFHSLWHLGAGYGTYLYILILIMLRIDAVKKDTLQIKFQTCPYPIHAIQIKPTDKQQ